MDGKSRISKLVISHVYTRTEIKIDIIQIRYGGYVICSMCIWIGVAVQKYSFTLVHRLGRS